MCLAVPGEVVKVETDALGMRMGTVDFDGITKEVCLALVPEVRPGDYVIVHAGFAISQLDPREAAETLSLLRQLAEASEALEEEADAEHGSAERGEEALSEHGGEGRGHALR